MLNKIFIANKLWETVLHTAHIDVPSNSPQIFLRIMKVIEGQWEVQDNVHSTRIWATVH